jgi:hypothetical protein
MNKNNKWESPQETKVGWLELFPITDGNGIMLAPMCRSDGNEKCFTSSNDKQCDHNVTTVELDEVGTSLCSLPDFTTVDIIGLLPTRPIIPHTYSARYWKIMRHGQM